MTARYRKRPVEVEAVRYLPPTNCAEIAEFTGQSHDSSGCSASSSWSISTLEGLMTAQPGDWIIRGVKGEFYPCKPDIFEATYEPVEIVLKAGSNKEKETDGETDSATR